MLKLCFDRRGIEAESIAVKEGKFLSETDVRQLRPKGDVALTDADGTSAQQPVFISVYFRDNLAMVVSVQNRTIVTAVGEDSIPGRFFTDIDSVAIL